MAEGEAGGLAAANRRFYDALWSRARLVGPERFGTWAAISPLLAAAPRRLELGPGLRPRLPLEGGVVLDLSHPALVSLRASGALAAEGSLERLPYRDAAFDLVAALDVLEHVADDAAALGEIARVSAPGGAVLLSVPLHPGRWTAFDAMVGHGRRYEPAALPGLLGRHGLRVEASAAHGMKPRNERLVALGMWFLARQPERAMWWFNRVFFPLGLRRDRPVPLSPGLADLSAAEDVLLLCRKESRG